MKYLFLFLRINFIVFQQNFYYYPRFKRITKKTAALNTQLLQCVIVLLRFISIYYTLYNAIVIAFVLNHLKPVNVLKISIFQHLIYTLLLLLLHFLLIVLFILNTTLLTNIHLLTYKQKHPGMINNIRIYIAPYIHYRSDCRMALVWSIE